MKVLYLVSTLQRSGPTSQLFYIISNLSKDITPVLVTLSPEPESSRLADFQQLKIKIIQLNLSRLKGAVFAKRRLAGLIEAEKPDIIHSQGVRSDVLASSFFRNTPVVCTVRCFPQLDFPMTYGWLVGKMICYFHTKALKKARLVCGVSESVTENLCAYFGLQRVKTVRNGVDIERFSRTHGSTSLKLREQFSIDKDDFVFISTGHLSLRKDPLFIVEAFLRLLKKHNHIKLIFVGDGELRPECIERVGEEHQDKVVFAGRVNNVEEFLNISDVYVSASKAEGMPNAVLEALACGLPVILSSISPHLELLGLDSRLGKSFEINDLTELELAMNNIIDARSSYPTDHIARFTSETLSSVVTAENYMYFYKELLTRNCIG